MQHGPVVLVDVREEAEHAAGNLGGVNMPLGTFAAHAKELPRDKQVVVYCRSGARSAQAVRHLLNMGYTQVMNLEGGVMAA